MQNLITFEAVAPTHTRKNLAPGFIWYVTGGVGTRGDLGGVGV